jgi:hypothetical protein
MVAQQSKLNNSSQIGESTHLINGFGFCLPQKLALRFKQKLSNRMAQHLKSAPYNKIIEAIIYRLEKCNQNENLWVAEDLHTVEGECFPARGTLAPCRSRLCSQCVSRSARINAKIADYVFNKLNPAYRRYIVLTMPDDSLSHLSLLKQREVFYKAWDWLIESDWWKDNVRGVIRCDEFTVKLDRKNLYHYHGNLLADCVFLPILRLRQQWAKALKFSYKHYGIEWDCPTKDGFPDVYIKRIVAKVKDEKKEISREKVIAELCKYATKPQDWDFVPLEDIAELVALKRFPRMFDLTGSCKAIAKGMRPKPRQNAINSPENVVNEQDNYCSNLNHSTYVHTKPLSVPKIHASSNHFGRPPPKLKQKSSFRRLQDNEITLEQYKIEFDFTVERTKRFRKIQLRQRYPFATFQTLDGQSF